MNVSEPEADTEYSRGPRGSEGDRSPSGALSLAVVAGTVLGAVLLLVAELTPLARVHSSAHGAGVIRTLGTGSNHAYALVPIALLAPALALSARRGGNRVALISIGILGLVALAIALLGDLPDAQASGLVGHAGGTYVSAASTPSVGLYLETLGAIVLLIASGAGLLLGGRAEAPMDARSAISGPRRSAS